MATAMSSPVIAANVIQGLTAEQITIQDNVVITGDLTCQDNVSFGTLLVGTELKVAGMLSKRQDAPQNIGNETLTMGKLRAGILLQESTDSVTAYLPNGTNVYNNLGVANVSIDWTVICYGIGVGSCSLWQNVGHAMIGNAFVIAGTSATFRTRVYSSNNAITYRIA